MGVRWCPGLGGGTLVSRSRWGGRGVRWCPGLGGGGGYVGVPV